MLHNESRKLLVRAFGKNHNAAQTAEDFSVSRWTVYRLRQQMERTGSVDLRVNERGHRCALTEQDVEAIDTLIQKQLDITLREIKETLQLKGVHRDYPQSGIKPSYHMKKKSIHASEQDRP